MREAEQIMCSMSTMPGCTGTTTVAVIDDLCRTYDTQCILCHGYVMRAEFIPITANTIAYKTVKI